MHFGPRGVPFVPPSDGVGHRSGGVRLSRGRSRASVQLGVPAEWSDADGGVARCLASAPSPSFLSSLCFFLVLDSFGMHLAADSAFWFL